MGIDCDGFLDIVPIESVIITIVIIIIIIIIIVIIIIIIIIIYLYKTFTEYTKQMQRIEHSKVRVDSA